MANGFKILLIIVFIYLMSGFIVYGNNELPEFPKPSFSLTTFGYFPGNNVWETIANFFITLGNIIVFIGQVIWYLFNVIIWIINVIIISATFSWIPEPYNFLVALPLVLAFIYGVYETIKEGGEAIPL
mgnify:CR=1 FL=1